MAPEQVNNIMSWWEGQSFAGKDLFQLTENGTITLTARPLIKEREIAIISIENCDTVLKNLQEKFESVSSKIRETEVEWMATEDKSKLADKIDQLKGFLNNTIAVGDFEQAAKLVNDWEISLKKVADENAAVKRALAEEAERLANSTQWKETAQAFKEIADKWKQAGFLDKGRNDNLWNRIEQARKAFHDRKRDHHDDEEKDLMVALDLKIELTERAEAMANSEDWKATTEAYQQLIEEWKAIGRTMPKKNEELWQRIMAAKSVFFERKRLHFTGIQQEQEINYGIKLALTERAEALKDSTEWSNTAQAMTALMEEWKATGRIPQDKADDLWKRFSGAQEVFFEARRRHTEEIRIAMEHNYALKSALLEKAEEIKTSSRWGEATAEMNRIFEEWKTIGPVPREHNNTIWEAFLNARKLFFQRKDTDRDQRKQYAESQKAAREAQEIADKKAREAHEIATRKTRIEQAHKTIAAANDEITEEEAKLADFKHAIENITPSKKAEELRTHLASLITESTKHLEHLKKKVVTVTEEMNRIIEKEQQKEMETSAS